MNPAIEVDRLLEQSGAVLIRQNKHYVYRLPNGRSFVKSKTPSDHRAAHNSLQDLRRMLGVEVVKETMEAAEVTTAPAAVVPLALQQPMPTPPEPPPPPAAVNPLVGRIAALVTQAEEEQEQYLLAAQLAERRVHLLKALEPFTDDPTIERTLHALLGTPKPPSPPSPVIKAAAVAAPQARQSPTPFPVIVTRDLVFEVAQKLGADNNAFTTVQITEIMIGDQKVSPKDRTRIMASISHAVTVLGDRGLLQLHEKGYGKKPALWLLPGPVKVKGPKSPLPNGAALPKVNVNEGVVDVMNATGTRVLRQHRTQ